MNRRVIANEPAPAIPSLRRFERDPKAGGSNAVEIPAQQNLLGAKESGNPRKRNFLIRHLGFILVVVGTTAAAAVYFGLIAADIYISEAQFVVRSSSQRATASGLSIFLQTAGLGNSSSDSAAVDAYLISRNALRDLEKSVDIRAIYDRPEADFLTRFPNFIFKPTFEYLLWHYQGWFMPGWVSVTFDSTSNITTVTVYAFRPRDAQRVARRLLELSELFVNALNERARNDSVGLARREVEDFQKQAADIEHQITDFRTKELMLDPNASSSAASSRLATLDASLVSTRALLSQLMKTAPGSPQIPELQTRLAALQEQIDSEEKSNAWGDSSLATKVAVYQQLLLKQQFIQQLLQIAMTARQTVEASAQAQRLYVEHVEEPNVQDMAYYPYRTLDAFLVFITSLLVYGTGRMLFAAIRERLRD